MQSIPQTLSFGQFVSFGWNVLKDNMGTLLKFVVIFIILIAVPNAIIGLFKPSIVTILLSIVLFFWQMILSMGIIKVSLNIIDNKVVTFDTLFETKSLLWTYLWATFRLSVQVTLGFIFFIVPGIMWAIEYQFVPMLIIDQGISADEAFKKSSEMTKGKRMDLFLFGLGFSVINIVGALLLGLGLLITVPVTSLAMVGLYRSLSKSKTSTSPVEVGQVVV